MPRDMTDAQFRAALKRNGFAAIVPGMWYRDTTRAPGCEGSMFGCVYHPRTYRLLKRETIAELIRKRKHAIDRATAKAGVP